MKYWIVISLLLLSISTTAQNKQPYQLGIGFAIATDPYSIGFDSIPGNIYEDSLLTQQWTNAEVYPFFFKPDYGLYHFICLEKTDSYYKVLVNDNESAFIPNDSNFCFKTWDLILLGSRVQRLNKQLPIRTQPSETSGIVENACESDLFGVDDVLQKNGEYWLSVYFSVDCQDYPDKNSKVMHGWIRWRDGNKLLVNIMLLC